MNKSNYATSNGTFLDTGRDSSTLGLASNSQMAEKIAINAVKINRLQKASDQHRTKFKVQVKNNVALPINLNVNKRCVGISLDKPS